MFLNMFYRYIIVHMYNCFYETKILNIILKSINYILINEYIINR